MTTLKGQRGEVAARVQLGQFLRTHRDALQPEQFGFPRRARRRSPGLLRYEVAQLAAVSDTWYTWLEQGRDIHISMSALDSIARALRLDSAGLAYARALAGLPEPDAPLDVDDPDDELAEMVRGLRPHSASVLSSTYEIVAWNELFERLWLKGRLDGPRRHNALWRMFVDPTLRTKFDDWEREAESITARFRFESAKHPGESRFDDLIRDLDEVSPEFRAIWSRAGVRPAPTRQTSITLPGYGRLVFHKLQMRVAHRPGLMLTMQSAADAPTAAVMAALTERAAVLRAAG